MHFLGGRGGQVNKVVGLCERSPSRSNRLKSTASSRPCRMTKLRLRSAASSVAPFSPTPEALASEANDEADKGPPASEMPSSSVVGPVIG